VCGAQRGTARERHSVALTEAERRRMGGGGSQHAVDERSGPDGRSCVPTRSRVVRSRPERGGDGSWSGVETGEEQERGDADAWGPGIVPAWFKLIQRFQMNSNQF
jgi:hypothetical protein